MRTQASSIIPPNPNPPSSLYNNKKTRCDGLDLLVKAAVQVAGDCFFLSLPFVQRKVIRRGKKALRFTEVKKQDKDMVPVSVSVSVSVSASSPKRGKRVMGLPSKFNDSVLLSWKKKTRQQRKPRKFFGSSGIVNAA